MYLPPRVLAVTESLVMAENFGEWLRRERTSRGLTLEGLAERTGGDLTHVAIGDWERGKREPKKFNLRIICAAILGEDASAEEVERLFWKGWSALGGHEAQVVREPDEEYLLEGIAAYTGDNPILMSAKAFQQALKDARERGEVTGNEPAHELAHGRGARKGITKIDG